MKLEICVADPQSLVEAIAGGADRIELCSALELGGLTPLPGLIAQAAAAPIPIYALVRPRSGDFVFGPADQDAMLRDIDAIRAAGLAGVVIGANRPNGELDVPVLERLVAHAAGLGASLHRSVDLVPDFAAATEAAIALGLERILTSGGADTALAGLENIVLAHTTAKGRLAIMAGSGVRPHNVGALLATRAVDEIHSSGAGEAYASAPGAVRLGFAAPKRRHTDARVVAALKLALS